MKSNTELQQDVQDTIKWQPLLNAAEIGVTAKDGVVSLTGVVDCYAKKTQAEDAAKNVAGVTALVEKIEVRYPSTYSKTDADIATEVLTALKARWDVPSDKVQVKVESGWITLTGDVGWNFQREAAADAIESLMGVKGVTNNIIIKSESKEAAEKAGIESALKRNWAFYDSDTGRQVLISPYALVAISEGKQSIAINLTKRCSVENIRDCIGSANAGGCKPAP